MMGQPLSTVPLFAVKLIFCHMHDNRQLTTLGLLELRVAKCSALPRWCGQHKPWPLLREGRESRDRASRTPCQSLRQRKSNLTLTSLPPRQARPGGHAVERTCSEERQLATRTKITYGSNLARRRRKSYFAQLWPLSGGILA